MELLLLARKVTHLSIKPSLISLPLIITNSMHLSNLGMSPTPRYGQCMVLQDDGIITVFGGSGSMYLNDIIQFDINEDEEDED